KVGLVASLARPGGNATGINFFTAEVNAAARTLAGAFAHSKAGCDADKSNQPNQHDVHPRRGGASCARPRAANPDRQCQHQPSDRRGVRGPFSRAAGCPIRRARWILYQSARSISAVRDVDELETTIAAQAREPNGSLVVMPDTFTSIHRAKITALAAQYHLPTVYPFRFFAANGGLVSYGTKTVDSYRHAANYADRILKGEKPDQLPVQGPTEFQLVINLKTAKALGLTIPANVLALADEVIE